jgi:hypothetical protein
MSCLRALVCAFGVCACAPSLDEIPTAPDAGPAPTGTTETFAFDAMFLGDCDRLGNAPLGNEWEQFGYDLDGKWTKRDSADVCGVARLAVDGDGGVDNAFGQLFATDSQSSAPYFSTFPTSTLVAALRDGDFTVQLQFDGLPTTGEDATNVAMRVFVSASFGAAPTFDGTTDWPVLASSVTDSTSIQSGAVVHFDSGYLTNGTFVSGTLSDGTLRIPISSAIMLPIHHATITFRRVGSALRDGIIAGVLLPSEVDSICPWNMDSRVDILHDGTNAASVPCDAVSIGLGFSARQVANPTQVVADPPPPSSEELFGACLFL